MQDLRTDFINTIISSLKLDDNNFIKSLIREYTDHVADEDFKKFVMALFGTDHSYLNGLDRVSKISEQFKPKDKDIEDKAKRVIKFAEDLNTQVHEEAIAQGGDFIKYVRGLKLNAKYDKTLALMELVKPYRNAREFIINIRAYQTSSDSLRVVIEAIKEYDRFSGQALIANSKINKMIKGK